MALVRSALTLRAVVMTGDARHERAHARLKLMRAAMRWQMPGPSAQPQGGLAGWALKASKNIFATGLNQVLNQPQPAAGARLALVLGSQAHWTSLLAGQVIELLVLALMWVVMAVVGGLAFAWVFWLHRPWCELAALTLLLMLPVVWWRWPVISRAPTAWPVACLG